MFIPNFINNSVQSILLTNLEDPIKHGFCIQQAKGLTEAMNKLYI